MKFSDFFCFKTIVAPLQAQDRDGAIKELIKSLDAKGCLGKDNAAKISRAVIKRENEASTGMGKTIAIPHVKHAAVKKPIATIGQSEQGIDFSALDKKLVHSVILLISPKDNTDLHLQAMEKIFKHLQNDKFRSFLRQAATSAQVADLLKEADENPTLQ